MKRLPATLFLAMGLPLVCGFSACQGGGAYPSYAGTYRLVRSSIEYRGLTLPGSSNPPETIEVIHALMGRGGTDPNRSVRILVTADGDSGPVLLSDIELNPYRSGASHVQVLTPSYSWHDPESSWRGVGLGYNCIYRVGASLNLSVAPSHSVLIAVYPWDGPPDAARWRAAGNPTITLRYSAGMGMLSSGEYCGPEAENPIDRINRGASAELTLMYEREEAIENVDLRSGSADAPEVVAATDAAAALPDGNHSIFPVPDTGLELVELLQSLL